MSDNKRAEEKAESKGTNFRDRWLQLSWAKIRKFEALVFLFMFFAVPWFGLRVVSYTKAHMLLNNITHDLVNDLHWTKEQAVSLNKKVTLKAVRPKTLVFSRPSKKAPFRYVIIYDLAVVQEVVLPEGITLNGIVTFNSDGLPESPSSFILSQGKRTSTIEIDRKGLVSVP